LRLVKSLVLSYQNYKHHLYCTLYGSKIYKPGYVWCKFALHLTSPSGLASPVKGVLLSLCKSHHKVAFKSTSVITFAATETMSSVRLAASITQWPTHVRREWSEHGDTSRCTTKAFISPFVSFHNDKTLGLSNPQAEVTSVVVALDQLMAWRDCASITTVIARQ
jgi:hypothetical protein